MKILMIIFILFIFPTIGNSERYDVYHLNEYLEYEVSFWGITLGNIKIHTDGEALVNENPVFKSRIKMNSAPSIPFVDLDAEFRSWIDTSYNFSHRFIGKELSEDLKTEEVYKFNYKKKEVDVSYKENEKLITKEVHKTGSKWNEGTSLYFFTRKHVNEKKNYKLATIVNRDTALTVINMINKKEELETDLVDYPMRSIYFSGKAHWKGIYGMSGEFEGWCSDDEASVPLLAKMNVYIGNVNLTLVKYRRKGWEPPKF